MKGAGMKHTKVVVIMGVAILVAGSRPACSADAPTIVEAADLWLELQSAGDGIQLLNLVDAVAKRNLAARQSMPLFAITLRPPGKADQATLTAEKGWSEVEIAGGGPVESPISSRQFQLRWLKPVDGRFGDLQVVVRLTAEPVTSSFRWTLKVEQTPAVWSLWRVVFPQVAIADLGPAAMVFVPKAAGVVQAGAWQSPFRYSGTYPSGWCSMPLLAAYDQNRHTGLSLAVHDPWGSTKDLLVERLRGEDQSHRR